MRKVIKITSLCLLLLPLIAGNHVMGQVKGDSYLKWYSWNATGGFMMPLNIFSTSLSDGIKHSYQFAGVPGYVFSIAKPVGLQIVVGAELEDQRTKGAMSGFLSQPEDTLYNLRTRTYSLFFQYYMRPDIDLNPFIMAKLGYGGINRAPLSRDLSRTIPADRWDFMIAAATGVTWHATPNISFNLYGEFSTIPVRYLPQLFKSLPSPEKKLFPTARVVLSVTGHTDIRVFYPFRRGKTLKKPTSKPHDYLPYSRVRTRK